MNPSSHFSLETAQKLRFSLSMKESLDVLQMPVEDLSFWLEKQIETNPLLNWKDLSYSKKKTIDAENCLPYEPSLFEYLMQQARHYLHDDLSLKQMEWIIGNLEDTGFFTQDLLSAPYGWNSDDLKTLIGLLQQFDPPGIGGKNIKECLLLQLRFLGKEDKLCYKIIQEHLENLLERRWHIICKQLLLQKEELLQIIEFDISPLDPFPGRRFYKQLTSFAIPDLSFIEEGDSWRIEVNEGILPSYEVLPYRQEKSLLNQEELLFIKKHLYQAHWIHTMIEKRRRTLHKIGTYIAQRQLTYLQQDTPFVLPLTIKEVAKKLSLHESTVARAVQNKHLSCKRGIIPLKSLFSHTVGDGNNSVSSDQAAQLLQKLIEEENKCTPLSDRELLEKMREQGVCCARRTISKYRKNLAIPPKSRRRLQRF